VKRGEVVLNGSEHHHLSRVARLRVGEEIHLFDEKGVKYFARIDEISAEATRLVILGAEERAAPSVRIILGQAVLKAKAMDFLIQKTTELGIFAIAPVVASRSVVRVEDGDKKKTERWANIALAASKQSKSGWVPTIWPAQDLPRFVAAQTSPVKIVLSEHEGRPLRERVLESMALRPGEVVLLVGPEGGWTPDEERMIRAHGFEAVSLGRTILRAETASLCAAAILTHFWDG